MNNGPQSFHCFCDGLGRHLYHGKDAEPIKRLLRKLGSQNTTQNATFSLTFEDRRLELSTILSEGFENPAK
ncbi:hypothetical protein KIN20_025613 [Parelaphostrongylus tenuis]|uniref:Uncharacterized protein n=1 Tax=Parelaphostrongylus tenuis TaxID=148309 RepID=A0AAD5MVJ9_PARTN|nr:hypothetical protein KIN20_025613 [Parelaphostrongylus tenuis]